MGFAPATTDGLCISRYADRGAVRAQEICGERADHVSVARPDRAEHLAAGLIGDLIELAPEHGETGLGVDPRRADVLVAEELLDVGDVHAEREQTGRHGVTQQVRIPGATTTRIFHDKLGILRDAQGSVVIFKGSMNETWAGLAGDPPSHFRSRSG